MIKVIIPITNTSQVPKEVIIPKGMLIQVNQNGLQNVIVSKTVSTTIEPGNQQKVEVEAYCANQNLGSPDKTTGKLSKFSINTPFNNQQEVWSILGKTISQPDLEEVAKLTELRHEMVESIRAIHTLRMIAADVGIILDNLPGDTLEEKCYYLIQHCMSSNTIHKLIQILHNRYPKKVLFTNWLSAIVVPS